MVGIIKNLLINQYISDILITSHGPVLVIINPYFSVFLETLDQNHVIHEIPPNRVFCLIERTREYVFVCIVLQFVDAVLAEGVSAVAQYFGSPHV